MLLKYEANLISLGQKHIVGIDEAGRGPLAGPMVVCGVKLNWEHLKILSNIADSENGGLKSQTDSNKLFETYLKINDSKKISEKLREMLEIFIKENAEICEIVVISNKEIDTIGISKCTQKAFMDIVNKIKSQQSNIHFLTDSFPINGYSRLLQTNIVRGDQQSISIAAASIVAKVTRDKIMKKFDSLYPEYKFAKHKGYGTKEHMEIINSYGTCPIHRKSFEPIKSIKG